ncbi:Rho termination factor N-terminal domain-containing protein, partial [bacterium]|nr:Rho termination factor N-terminal domain-containing protein [bacterium]
MEEQVLKSKKIAELKQVAAAFGIAGSEKMKKTEIIDALLALRET